MSKRSLFVVLVCSSSACQAPTPPMANQACGGDVDGDGLDECDELELGTDPELADTDGDGDSDSAELDCLSDPLDGDEACYLCGWARADPGDLVSTGAQVGDTVSELQFIDQCADDVSLWDFAGTYRVLYMLPAWASGFLPEVSGLGSDATTFTEETGIDVGFLVVLYESHTGGLADGETAETFANEAGVWPLPVLADPSQSVLYETPYTGGQGPGLCALSPDMVIVACSEGDDDTSAILAEVASHAQEGAD